jgi:Fe-S-cluster containining protein
MTADRELIQIVDAALAEAASRAGSWLACRPGCFDCCIGPFPISALDAERLSEGFTGLASHDPARAARVRTRALAYGAGEDEPCPALDPVAGTCDLYDARPLTCRTFGPAIHGAGGIGVCELCFVGATEDEIAACAVELDTDSLEAPLLDGRNEETTVAAALVDGPAHVR